MKFSIRDLFLVTLVVALAVGWWVDRSRLTKRVFRSNGANGHKMPVEDRPTPAFEERMRESLAPAINPPKD